jgi:hypothetical protein
MTEPKRSHVAVAIKGSAVLDTRKGYAELLITWR